MISQISFTNICANIDICSESKLCWIVAERKNIAAGLHVSGQNRRPVRNHGTQRWKLKSARTKAPDRRVARTQRALREALHSLIREKSYDSIVVKEILDRADVGRSAFYMHFRDKDELLASSIEDLLSSVPPARTAGRESRVDRILWFSLPILEHVGEQLGGHHGAGGMRIGQRGRAVLHGHLRNVLAGLILEQLSKNSPTRRKVPGNLLSTYLAASFVLVLDWWVDSRAALSARAVNELFRALVTPTLESGWK